MIKQAGWILIVVFLMNGFSCQSPITTAKPVQGKLNLRANTSALGITLNQVSNRNIVPSGVDLNTVTYTLTLTPGSTLSTEITDSNSTGTFSIASIDTGTWQAALTAKSGTTVIGTSTQSLTITTTATTNVVLNLLPPTGTGSFKLTVNWPSTQTNISMGGTLQCGSNSPVVLSTITSTPGLWNMTNLPSGIYLLKMASTNGGTASWGLTEVVYILKGVETTATYTLTDADL